MPQITAFYASRSATGLNAVDRGRGNTRAPSLDISNKAPKLYEFMASLDEEGGRSAFACAEAQALAKLLAKLDTRPDKLSDITFSTPVSGMGYVLWQPCANCSAWLEAAGGWGSSQTYRIKTTWDPEQEQAPSFSADDFPSLRRR